MKSSVASPETAASPKINILLVEDDRDDAEIVERSLAEDEGLNFTLTRADTLESALRCLREKPVDVMLLDLSLPDAEGIATFLKARQERADTPIIVLTGRDDEKLATRTVQQGAQDYIVKQNMNSATLVRSVRYALQRQTLINELRALSLTDELTGLYNRRGFIFLAQQQLNAADRRQDESLVLFLADLDNMKWINDTCGHQEGDHALIDFTNILKKTFRYSDILGRIGGDEFAVLAADHSKNHLAQMVRRLRAEVEEHKQRGERPFEIRFSVGMVRYDRQQHPNIQDMLHKADLLMYREKNAKKKAAGV